MDALIFIRFSVLFFAILYERVDAGSVTFCDGSTHVEKTREQCSAGISFGDRRPDCICVTGIYRFITDSCETADGFAETVCTKLADDSGANIIGVKFTRDPVNWSQTGVVCERKGFGSETWDFITEKHSRGSTTKSTNIYAINGKAYIAAGHHDKKAFCVEPATVSETEKVCRYLKSENEDIWKDSELEINVKPKCDGKPLKPHRCFGILSSDDSECELSCSKTRSKPAMMMGRAMGDDVPAAPTPKKGKGGKATTTTTTPAPDLTHPAQYWKHDNKFLNRKMMIYNIINQLNSHDSGNESSEGNSTNVTFGEPKRTFELFSIMKDTMIKYCPDEYVAPDWIELVIELFYILHRGNIFKYDETLSMSEYEWIKEILTKCHERITENHEENIVLSSLSTVDDPTDDICQAHGGLATGYCNGTTTDGDCNFKPIPVETHRANDSYHYVPDVAWDVVDIIQVICFPEFNASYRMFHVLEQAAEKLFTLQIKNLWYFPTWSEKTKKRLLGTSADAMMHNLEVCINSAYDHNGQIPRLVRPPPAKYLRKKRSLSKPPVNQGDEVDYFCSKSRKDFAMPSNCQR